MGEIRYKDELSLKEISLRRTAVVLWNSPNNQNALKLFLLSLNSNKIDHWDELVGTVKEQVLELPLPRSLMNEMMFLIKPVGAEIRKVLRYYRNGVAPIEYQTVLNSLIWTNKGTIDSHKTAVNLVRRENELSSLNRYIVSCLHCLEDDIPVIWAKLSDRERNSCFAGTVHSPQQQRLIDFWTKTLIPDSWLLRQSISRSILYELALETSAAAGNLAAVQYFFRKLEHEQREEALMRAVHKVAAKMNSRMSMQPREVYGDIMCYLLTQMNWPAQQRVLRRYPYKVLISFLDWPRQNMVPHVLENIWYFLSPLDYHRLACILIRESNFSSYKYAELFRKVYLISPKIHKKSLILYQCPYGTFLAHLFHSNDEETIKFILRNIKMENKETLFTTIPVVSICNELILTDKWDMLEVLITECRLSTEARAKIRDFFKENLSWISFGKKDLPFLKEKIDVLFHRLDVANPMPPAKM